MNQTVRSTFRPFSSAPHSARRAPLRTPRLRWTGLTVRAAPESGTAEVAEPSNATPKSTSELAKEALMQTIKSEATTAKDVLGESTLAQLKQALGDERAGQFIGALDGLLANRRLATLIFAVVDVALIFVLIKVFRVAVLHD